MAQNPYEYPVESMIVFDEPPRFWDTFLFRLVNDDAIHSLNEVFGAALPTTDHGYFTVAAPYLDPLTSDRDCITVTILNPIKRLKDSPMVDNTEDIWVGNGWRQAHLLHPGDEVTLDISLFSRVGLRNPNTTGQDYIDITILFLAKDE